MTTGDLAKYLPSDSSPEINFNLEGFNTHYPGIARPEITLVAVSSVFPPILSPQPDTPLPLPSWIDLPQARPNIGAKL